MGVTFLKRGNAESNKFKRFTKNYCLLLMTSVKLGFQNSFPFLHKALNELTTFLNYSL